MKNILVALDFSASTEKIIEQAAQLGTAFQAKIWLIHVAAPEPDFVGYEAGPQYIRDDRAEKLRGEHHNLQQYAAQLKAQHITTEALLVQGPTAETILVEAKKLKADLIIIGSRGHGNLYNTFVGSVCADVIKKADIPMLLVPVKSQK